MDVSVGSRIPRPENLISGRLILFINIIIIIILPTVRLRDIRMECQMADQLFI